MTSAITDISNIVVSYDSTDFDDKGDTYWDNNFEMWTE